MKYARRPSIPTIRKVWLCCLAIVTALLLVPNPGAMVGLGQVPLSAYSLAAHLFFLFLLSAITFASRFPFSLPATLALLVTYGAGVELLQGAVPRRTVSFADFVANSVGIALGATAYAAARWYWRRRTTKLE